MISISKFEHCTERAAKCLSLAQSMMYASMLAPTKSDFESCVRRQNRHMKHCKKYQTLAKYYGGIR